MWTGARIDLSEVIVGLYEADVIRLTDGRRPSFASFAKFVGHFFGISYDAPHDDLRKVLIRKKDPTPFFHRLIECIRHKSST